MYAIITTFEATRNVAVFREDGTKFYDTNFSTENYELVRNSNTQHFEIVKNNVTHFSVPFSNTIVVKGTEP